MARRRLHLGELPIDQLTFGEALEELSARIDGKRGGLVFTPNVDHVVLAETNERFRRAYQDAALSFADGMPVVWASRVLGLPLPERIAGADIILPLLERAGQRGWRVYFLGAGPGVAEKAAEVVRAKYGTNVVGCDAPMIKVDATPAENEAIVAKIRAAKPDVLLVAFGAPKQEIWMHNVREELGSTVALGIGAGLDFIAGNVARAPVWMSKAGLEWLYRLSREPKRLWRRYLIQDPKFAAILLKTMRRPAHERVSDAA